MARTIISSITEDETEFAVVEWGGCHRTELRYKLTKAITAWSKTEEGKANLFFCDLTSFNIVDLSGLLPATTNSQLKACLVRQGITYLDIEVFSDSDPIVSGLDLGTVLIEEDRWTTVIPADL